MKKKKNESNFAKKILPEYQEKNPDTITFRNNSGMLYTGKTSWKVIDGKKCLIIENPTPVFFGVGKPVKDKKTRRIKQKGGGDRIGWTTKEIASPCCGSCEKFKACFHVNYYNIKVCIFYKPIGKKKIAVFTNLELKTKNVPESKEQIQFREMVIAAGGISEVLREE